MKQLIAVTLGLATVLAFQGCEDEATVVATAPVNCISIVKAAALKAMSRTNVPGQLSIYGDPVLFGAYHLRVDVKSFDVLYAVDVIIDRKCNVLSVSTDRETNPPP